MIITIVWKHCFLTDNIIITKSCCLVALHPYLAYFYQQGAGLTWSSLFPPWRGTFFLWGRGAGGWQVPTNTWPSSLPWHNKVLFVGKSAFHLVDENLLSLMPWEDAVLSPPWADGFWQSVGEMVGVGHGASEEKHQYQHSEHILCVCVCWMTNCLLSQHQSSESVLWWFVWVVDTVTYRASVAVINLLPFLWGVSQSLFFLQNRDLYASFSARPNNTFCEEFR